MFDVDNPEPSQQEMDDATEAIAGSRLKNRKWTLDKLSDAAFDFGITDEPPRELSRWLEDKGALRFSAGTSFVTTQMDGVSMDCAANDAMKRE